MSGTTSELDEDSEAIRAVLAGDSGRFRVIVDRYSGRVMALAMRMLRNRHASEDVTQEVFLKAYRALDTFRGEARFYSWLMRIAYNVAVDAVKAARPSVDIDELPIAGPETDPAQALLAEAARHEVRRAVASLKPEAAACIELFFFFGLKHEEISRTIDLPVNTVKSHIFRAKQRLRITLAEAAGEVT